MDMSRIDLEFGEALRIARQAKGVTQEELADAVEAMGVKLSQATIGKIERGERKVTVGESQALARGLRIWGEELIHGISGASALALRERLNTLRDEAKDALHAFEAGQSLVRVQLGKLNDDDRGSLLDAVRESLEDLVEDYRRDRQAANESLRTRQELDGDPIPDDASYDPRRGYAHPHANAMILRLPDDG